MAASEQSPRAGAYRHQDGQALFTVQPQSDPHAQWRLPQRVPDDWADEDVRVLWADAVPVDFPPASDEAYARYHQETDTVVLAEFGFLTTIYQLKRCDDPVKTYVRQQVVGQ